MTDMYMFNWKSSRGFTLLELLIVVAIIGIILSISIAYLATSRNKGGNAGIQQNLINARVQAEVYYTNNGASYEGVCEADDEATNERIAKHVDAAIRAYGKEPAAYADGTASTWNTAACHDSAGDYAAWVPLKGSTDGAVSGLCIDSTSAAREVSEVLGAGAVVCP